MMFATIEEDRRMEIQEQELCSRFLTAIPLRVNADAHLVWRGRTLCADHCELG
jgi:hypothetical protein